MDNLSTPKTVQKLQKALHAKAKAEVGYRFYALYDKIRGRLYCSFRSHISPNTRPPTAEEHSNRNTPASAL